MLFAAGCSAPQVAPVETLATPIAGPSPTAQPAAAASSPAGEARPTIIPSATAIAPTATPLGGPRPAGVAVAPNAPRVLLQPMTHEYETWNNCAPVTAEMVLSFFGIHRTQAQIAPILRPNPKNFSVRLDQIGTFLTGYGLQAHPLVGGTLELLKQFASNGIPVVTEDQLSLQEDYGHFRVVRGYDDAAGVIILGDSYYGPENRLPYNLYSELWKRHDYAFMPVYRPSQAAIVQAILGARFDASTNDAAASAAARQMVAANPSDAFAWLDLGQDLFQQGEFGPAISAWQRARAGPLTPRTLWYTIWPAAAYNHLGQYTQALAVTTVPLAGDPNNAAALLQKGLAERALGRGAPARADLAQAIAIDPSLAGAAA